MSTKNLEQFQLICRFIIFLNRSLACPYCGVDTERTVQLFLIGDGPELNNRLHQWHELIKSVLELLADRSSYIQVNQVEKFGELIDFMKGVGK